MLEPRLFLDIQTIQNQTSADRGIPRFGTELARALIDAGAPIAALALNPLVPWPRRIHPDLAGAPQLTWNTATAFRRALADGPVTYVVVSPFELSRPVQGVLGAHVVGVPRVAIVHDLIPHLFPELFDLHDTALGRVYERRLDTIRSFDLVLTPSESTRRDVIAHLDVAPDRVCVIGEAASPYFVACRSEDDPAALVRSELSAISRPFVLCVSGWEGHKNTESLIEAWARLGRPVREHYQLVVACSLPDEGRRAWTSIAERQGISPDEIVMTGFVEDAVLRALYQTAALFVLPSRYEGFGLPVLEAISCGCAAISSNTSSLPELIDWPPGTFSPDDPDEIALLIERALTEPAYRTELDLRSREALRRHSWSRVVDRILAACAELRESSHPRPRRLRLAVVGPFPPARSWIAGYNAQLADRLAVRCDVDCFTHPLGPPTIGSGRSRAYRMFPVAALGPTLPPAAYDAILYTIGREPDDAYRLAKTYPGLLWLHDLALADGDLIARARGVIVDSEPARDVLEQELGPDDARPTWVVPPAASDAFARTQSHGTHVRPSTFDEVARCVVEIAAHDLEPSRPDEAPPPVSASVA